MKNMPLVWVNLRQVWVASLCLYVGFIASFSVPAQAAEQNFQRAVYEVYAGGIHALRAELTIDLSEKDRYDVALDAHTRGFLGRLVPWKGRFETQGWVEDKKTDYQPEIHRSSAVWKGEDDIKTYRYKRDGAFKDLEIEEDGRVPYHKKVDPNLTNQSVDILSATLDMLTHVATGDLCESTSEIFDGKRRFALVFNPEDTVDLTSSRYNIYTGPAQSCTVEVKPLAGAWHKKPRGWLSIQEQGRAKGLMPTVWVARMSKNAPAIPVKVRVKTDYGVLFMHLAEYTKTRP